MCFDLFFFEQLLIWLVLLGVFVALCKLLLPLLFNLMGWGGSIILQVINILIWGAVAIFIIRLLFYLFACLAGSGLGLGFRHG
jgi:hypothetical protein